MVERSAQEFVLSPNNSFSWRGNQLLFLSLCAISGTVSIILAFMGFWLTIPFVILHMSLLWGGLYVVAKRCLRREVITINDDTIQIEKGHSQPEHYWTLHRVWARVILERPASRLHPSRLLIHSHGQAVEVGQFLNEDERQRLAFDLRHSLN